MLQLVGGAGKQENEEKKNNQRVKVTLTQNEINVASRACSTWERITWTGWAEGGGAARLG